MNSSLTHIAWIAPDQGEIQSSIDHLQAHGYNVQYEHTEKEWEADSIDHQTDLIIVSHSQNTKEAINICLNAKNFCSNKVLPSLLIAKDITETEKEEYFKSKGHGLIIEPFGPDELLSKVQLFIDYQKTKKELNTQMEEVSEMAMLAMENSSDLGGIVNFVKNSIKAKTYEELSNHIFEAVGSYSEDALVEIKGHKDFHYFSTEDSIDPNAKHFLIQHKNLDRLSQLEKSIQINHEYIVLLINGLPIHDAAKMGRISDTLVMLSDAANRFAQSLATEENLKLAEDSRRAFLNTLSHELRTPLNGILGFSKALSMKKEDHLIGSSGIDALNRIFDSTSQINAIVTTLIDISHEASEDTRNPESSIEIENLLLLLRVQFNKASTEKNLEIEISCEENLTTFGEKKKLSAMLNHLVDNAVKFTDEGKITLSASRQINENEDEFIEFKVSDTGIGIDTKDHVRIFEEIGQLNTEHNRRHYGVGLGLYYVKLSSQQMNGYVAVESELGKGSTFTLKIPMGYPIPAEQPTQSGNIEDLLF
mgnify:CR=1 FL=1